MNDNSGKILKTVNPTKIILPILIGLGFAAFLLRDFDFKTLSIIEITTVSFFFLLFAFLLMVIRDFGYMWRIRLLSNNQLTWRKSLNIVMLWEFTSAITPSAVGGTSVAIFFVNKEGISLGKSSAMVLMTSLLDELFFVVAFPIAILLFAHSDLSIVDGSGKFLWIVITGYFLKLAYSIFVFYGLLVNPRGLKWLLLMIFKLPIIRRWRPEANQSGDDLVEASLQFKSWPIKSWLKAIVATSLSWTARFWVVNALIIFMFGLSYLSFSTHLLVYTKQLFMWIMLLIFPTPGGTGFAELAFNEFLAGDIPAGMESFMAVLWRAVTYYPYLIIGAFLIPRWIRKHFIKNLNRGKDMV